MVVALLAIFAPTLVGFTSLPASLLAGAVPPEAGELTAEGVSLSWTGPTVVSRLKFSDPQGNALFAAERVEVAGGVMGLLGGNTSPLSVKVEQPRIDLVLTDSGTNFDQLLAVLEAKRSEQAIAEDGNTVAAKRGRPIQVTVLDAAVRVTEAKSGAQWIAEGVEVFFSDPGRGIDAIALTANGTLSVTGDSPDQGNFKVLLGASQNETRLATIEINAAPLALLEPILRRIDPGAAVAGTTNVRGEAVWRPNTTAISSTAPADIVRALIAGGIRSSGTMRLEGFGFRSQATGGEPVRLSAVEVPWRLAAVENGLAVQQLDFQSEVASGKVTGVITPAEVAAWSQGVSVAPRDLRLDGRLDLERLASVAPQALRLQPGTRIESGRLGVNVDSLDGRVVMKLNSGPLTGVAQGKRIEWREPLDVRLAALQTDPLAGTSGWSLEAFEADSSFFNGTVSGDASRLKCEGDFDLNRLANELAPFVELGSTRLAGSGRADFTLLRNKERGRWQIDGSGRVEGLLVGTADTPIANEPNLRLNVSLDGSMQDLTEPPVGQVELSAGKDRLLVTLPDSQALTAQPFKLALSGDLARWYRRASAIRKDLPAPESIALSGGIEVNATGRWGAGGGQLDQSKVILTGLNLDTAELDPSIPRWRLSNEQVTVSAEANWRNDEQVVQLLEGQFISSVASAAIRNIVVALSNPAESQGEIVYRVNLGRLNGWMVPRGKPARYAAAGEVEGLLQLQGLPEGIRVVASGIGQALSLVDRYPETTPGSRPATRPVQVWSERQMRLDVDALVASIAGVNGGPSTYAIDLRDAKVKSASVDGSFGGQIADVATMRGVRLSGGIDYDLEKITPMLWPSLGDGIRLVGRDRATFRIETNESAPADAALIARLRGTVAAPWESADLFGLAVGSGRLSAALDAGVVRMNPLDIAIGGGRLTAEAAATLDPKPSVLNLKPGPLLTDVGMSQEVNERLLKYIAPILADATRIDGRFSLTMRELALPLDPPPTTGPPSGRAAGLLTIQRVRVTPGPTTAEWVTLIRQIEGLLRDGVESVVQPKDSVLVAIDDANVEFQMVDGRIYHRGLSFYVGDALVQSSGSVGVDETLNLVLTIPILDKWVDRRPQYLSAMRGQALRVPVQGTFSKPRVNKDAFKQLSQQLLQSAGQGLLEGLLRKALE